MGTPPSEAELVVVGAGYIGMELSTAFAKLGTDVTVLEALDAPLPAHESDLVDPVRERAAEPGIDLHFGEKAVEWYRDIAGDAVVITEDEDGSEHEYPAESVLVAVGREPVTGGLDLAAAGIEPDDDGFVPTDETGRPTTSGSTPSATSRANRCWPTPRATRASAQSRTPTPANSSAARWSVPRRRN